MRYENIYKKLADFGRDLLSDTSYEKGLPRIAKYAKEVIGAHRCSIFINDLEKGELWTTLADDIERIKIPSDKGLVGHTIKEKKPLIENDPYTNPHFLPDIDKESGYVTKNIVTAPIFNSKREIIGVLQLLNKPEGFDKEDIKFMIFFAHYVSGYLELIDLCLMEDSNNTENQD
ncbi:GAF domain-containing protein [Sulfurimonas sp.]|uniref:GAF domain-containing protein n=1 Tax=Sulfurimonas sp. TaxID=2022749 RepID=UPI00356AD5F8